MKEGKKGREKGNGKREGKKGREKGKGKREGKKGMEKGFGAQHIHIGVLKPYGGAAHPHVPTYTFIYTPHTSKISIFGV